MEGEYVKMEKVHKFEEFVDRRLKPDLVNAMAERDKVLEQQKIFSDLKTNIQMLESNGLTRLRTMVNLGSEVYVQADVPDTRHIFVDIGLGFYAEFTWSEALQFISTKEKALSRMLKCHLEPLTGKLKIILVKLQISKHKSNWFVKVSGNYSIFRRMIMVQEVSVKMD